VNALQRQQQPPSPSATRAPSLAGVEASRGPDGVLSAPASTATASERAIVGAMMEDPRASLAEISNAVGCDRSTASRIRNRTGFESGGVA